MAINLRIPEVFNPLVITGGGIKAWSLLLLFVVDSFGSLDHWKGGRAFNPIDCALGLDTFLRAGELTDNDTLRTLTLAPPAIVQNNSVLHPTTQTNVVFIIV